MKLFKGLSPQRECKISKFFNISRFMQFDENYAPLNMKLIFAVYDTSRECEESQ